MNNLARLQPTFTEESASIIHMDGLQRNRAAAQKHMKLWIATVTVKDAMVRCAAFRLPTRKRYAIRTDAGDKKKTGGPEIPPVFSMLGSVGEAPRRLSAGRTTSGTASTAAAHIHG
ncbi:MAG: hypothetical protein EA399_14875 [Desulfovibrionales bacterium]|nr:MAG: hypothetical protein EA399_14875 [Desulfovibrionales bacterium]